MQNGYIMQGHGLSEKQVALCDAFVYIPQYGDGTASLNVTVATSIVLQHFAQWAGYREHRRQGQKFVVGERPQRTAPRGAIAVQWEPAWQHKNVGPFCSAIKFSMLALWGRMAWVL